MIIPDVNLLVYAYHADDPRHEAARKWWEDLLNGREPVGLSWVTVGGFVRLMTHPRVLAEPMPVRQATRHVRTWLASSPVVVLSPGRRFSEFFLGYLDALDSGGNLTTDAHLAALAVEYQAELHSCDLDFSRFSGLRWRNPLKG
jgi:toxin-antitoxin system PIN domain toxin